MVGVLVFVDQDVPEPSAVVLRDLRVALQHRHRLTDQIVEVERVRRAQAALILAVDLGHDARQVVAVRHQVEHRLLRTDQLVFQVGNRIGQQAWRVALDVDAHIAADHQQQPPGVVGVVDRKVRVAPGQQCGLLTQYPHAGGVERRHPHGPGPRADEFGHPVAHLGGGLVGEGDGQDLTRTDATVGMFADDGVMDDVEALTEVYLRVLDGFFAPAAR